MGKYIELKIGDKIQFLNHGGRFSGERMIGVVTLIEFLSGGEKRWGKDGDINAVFIDDKGNKGLYRVYTSYCGSISYTDKYMVIEKIKENYDLWL